MRLLKALFIAALIGFALWAGLWYFGYKQATEETARFLSENENIEAAAVDISGFPSRYDINFQDISVEGNGFRWQTSEANIYRLPYQTAHLVMTLPAEQVFENDLGKLIVYSPEMKASLDLDANDKTRINELIFDTENLQAEGQFAGVKFDNTSFERGMFALRKSPDIANEYLTYAKFENLKFGAFEPQLFEIDGRSVLSHEPMVYPNPRPHATNLDLTRIHVELMDSVLAGHGSLALNQSNRYDGVLHLNWTNWQAEIDIIASRFGLDGLASKILAQLFEDKATGALIFDLYIENSIVKLGPFALGTLPTIEI